MKLHFLPAVAAIGLLVSGTASSSTLLFDFNTINGSGGPGGTWNVYAVPADLNAGTFLLDSTGTPTPFTISAPTGVSDSSNFGPTTIFNNTSPDSLPAWATSATDNTASGDYFFTNTGTTAAQNTFTLTISGLTAGNTFSLDLLASRNETAFAGGLYEYSLNGSNWFGFTVLNSDGSLALTDGWDTFTTQTKAFNNETQGYNLHRYMNASDIVATGSSVQIRLTDSSLNDASINTSYSVLNAMQMTVVPEPATIGLLGVGLGAVMRRRRGRSR